MWTLRCFITCVHRCSLSWVELSIGPVVRLFCYLFNCHRLFVGVALWAWSACIDYSYYFTKWNVLMMTLWCKTVMNLQKWRLTITVAVVSASLLLIVTWYVSCWWLCLDAGNPAWATLHLFRAVNDIASRVRVSGIRVRVSRFMVLLLLRYLEMASACQLPTE